METQLPGANSGADSRFARNAIQLPPEMSGKKKKDWLKSHLCIFERMFMLKSPSY